MPQKVSRICLLKTKQSIRFLIGVYMKLKGIIYILFFIAATVMGQHLTTPANPVINPNMVDGVLAHVNGKPIMLTDIYPYIPANRRKIIENNLMPNATSYEIDEKCLFLSLDDAINNNLIIEAYHNNPDLSIPANYIDQRINEIIETKFGGSRAKLIEELVKSRLTYQAWRESIEENIIQSAMFSFNIAQNIHISNSDIFKEYNSNKDKYTIKSSTHLGILQAETEEVYTNVVAKLAAKEDFSAIIKELELTGKENDPAGSIGWVNIKEDLTPIFGEPATALKVGEISAPISVEGKYYFIKKFEEKPGYQKPFTEVRKEIEAEIFAREVERLKAEWIKRLRSEAAIEYHIEKR